MQTSLDALHNAVRLLVTLDAQVVEYATRSLGIACLSTVIAAAAGIPVGMLLAEFEFRGKRLVITVLNTLLAMPTVVIGLFVYSLLSRTGPMGRFQLLFTVPGIVFGEVLLILPTVAAFTLTAVSHAQRDVRKTALALGASPLQARWLILRESRFGVLAAVIAVFGRVISEVGVATIVGGNVDRFTRTLTTAIVLHVDMGSFALALALGLVLLGISLMSNILFQLAQGRLPD